MAGFGELVLVLGDLHIPQRRNEIPEQFKRMLVPGKMQHVICTGNIGASEQYDEIRELAPNVHCVAGDYDDAQAFPEHKVISVGDFSIGIIHGHQVIPWGNQDALARMRRKLHCDVLVSGHTHVHEIIEYDNHYHINPGSITGAYASTTRNVTPSFILLSIDGPKMTCYLYELVNGEVDVSKKEFTKETLQSTTKPMLESLLA
jgi:vacuolar protein sorting-associated protein 29